LQLIPGVVHSLRSRRKDEAYSRLDQNEGTSCESGGARGEVQSRARGRGDWAVSLGNWHRQPCPGGAVVNPSPTLKGAPRGVSRRKRVRCVGVVVSRRHGHQPRSREVHGYPAHCPIHFSRTPGMASGSGSGAKAVDCFSERGRPNHRGAQQCTETDEVRTDGRGPSRLSAVFYGPWQA